MRWGWVAPFVAIMAGWLVAEFGRQPWIVYGVLKTADAYSKAVPAEQVLVTLFVFVVLYTIIVVAFVRLFTKFVHEGPDGEAEPGSGLRGGRLQGERLQGEVAKGEAPAASHAPVASAASHAPAAPAVPPMSGAAPHVPAAGKGGRS